MRLWQLASIAFFIYVAIVALGRWTRHPPARKALAGAAGGLVVVLVSRAVDVPILMEWIWPPLLLLIAYWTSGPLFVVPSPSQESLLLWLDERVAVRAMARHTPRALVEVFEAAYAGVYLLVPLALLVQLEFSPSSDPDHFWSVVLITDFVCFAVLPWVQTRPPRALEAGEPWVSSIRRLNLSLLGATSIEVNTFPSGHAAEGARRCAARPAAPAGIVFR